MAAEQVWGVGKPLEGQGHMWPLLHKSCVAVKWLGYCSQLVAKVVCLSRSHCEELQTHEAHSYKIGAVFPCRAVLSSTF